MLCDMQAMVLQDNRDKKITLSQFNILLLGLTNFMRNLTPSSCKKLISPFKAIFFYGRAYSQLGLDETLNCLCFT